MNTIKEPMKTSIFLENRKLTELDFQKEPCVKSETTVSHFGDVNPSSIPSLKEKIIGFYTVDERRKKILKYRLKIHKFLRGENKNKDRYIKRSKIAKAKPRVGGKFASKSKGEKAVKIAKIAKTT
mmetsp:Transcript_16915/g.18879  ORF Transcript_16915/g.18879 Transcript_16915/m.18879 type:complete len:125 (-) Transcript_16915:39-413(-)